MPPEKSERFPCKAQNCENEGIIPSKDDNDIFLCRFKSDAQYCEEFKIQYFHNYGTLDPKNQTC